MYYSNKCQLFYTCEQTGGDRSWSMDITTFSTLDLREQGHKSYVASYQVNEELVILRMFSCELRQWRWFAKDFFHERFPIYGITYEAILAPDMKSHAVRTFVIPLYSKFSNCHAYYNAIALL